MAYDEPSYRRHTSTGDGDGGGYRTGTFASPDYRARRSTQDYQPPVDYAQTEFGATEDLDENASRRGALAGPDPADGRDRIGIHLGWEVVLLLGAAAMGYLLWREDADALKGDALDTLLLSGAAIGLLALAAGLTLRAGVPNLAVGPIAIAAALHFAENGDRGVVPAAGQAVAVAVVGAVVIALIVVAFHVPGWVATLGGALAVVTYNQLRVAPVNVQGDFDPSNRAYFVFAGFAVLALGGGLLGVLPGVRRWLGRLRPTGDPAVRPGGAAALPVITSLVLSSVMAVGAGVLFAANATGPVAPRTGLEWTGIAVGAALIAGTSAYGRRGGIFGTLFAVVILTVFLDYAARRDLDIALFAIAAAALGAGLVVTRLVETYGRPLPAPGDDDDWQATTGTTASWSPAMPDTWSTAAPAQPSGGRADRWDDRWGTNAR
ncbi:ABC transporter permease [Spirilliplanes yamanashiensis]|uniref:ABC transporter permease n=1 Tax=Spirilliplanes yamanashiensis TaxID=42233 RepID=A0A8J3Y667_9ACTN|nr:ABC transporter permease [Spirilliplanes yamanashiensis]MDP9814587.1 ribose/xylose/arabinose/galactoside ABC-type transport system permease subunit [Spirilliplanes yamanashiensis]GIJ02239.1 hypothetical protein Sya03_15910 [Spirilliplanes yamanashiensis]